MLELSHINKYYNAGTVNEMCLFQDFNLTIRDGEFVSVVGSNGSGKTSMLNIICGSIPVDSGTIAKMCIRDRPYAHPESETQWESWLTLKAPWPVSVRRTIRPP